MSRVDALLVPSRDSRYYQDSGLGRCLDSSTGQSASGAYCEPAVVRLGVILDLDLVVPNASRPFFLGVGYRTGAGVSTVIGSAGVFFHAPDRQVNGYVRLTGGSRFFELSVGAFLSNGR